jgi:hypothetical protein
MDIMKRHLVWLGKNKYGLLIAIMGYLPFYSYGAPVEEHMSKAEKWNHFAESLQTLSSHLIKITDVRKEELTGGYGGVTDELEFYRETKYYDIKTGKLISKVKMENKYPDRLHAIEVYIYDESGHVKRDYSATYLPVHRKAPYQTLINIYHYKDGLRGYRQFDASDDVLYEQCKGTYKNEEVLISLVDYEIPDHPGQLTDNTTQAAYRICFENMPATAAPYLDPLQEIPLLDRN